MTVRDLPTGYERRMSASHDIGLAAPWSEGAPSLFEILQRRKLTILVTWLAFLLGGVMYVLISPPLFLGSTSMLIDPRLGQTVGSDPLQPGYIPDTGAMDSQIKLFTSQTVLKRVADMAHLADDPEFNGSERSLLQRLLHPAPDLAGKVDLKVLESAITIKRPERTYVVGIEALARSPTRAAEIANDVAKAYIEDQVSSRIEAARGDSSFVKDKLDTLSAQLKAAEDKVEAYKIANNIIDTTGLRSNQQQVMDLTKSLGEARAKESDAKAAVAEIDGMARDGHLDATSEALKSPTIERLRQLQAEADENVAKLAMTLGFAHPELKEARARAREATTAIRAELKRLKLSTMQDYQAAKKHQEQIARGVDKLKEQSVELNRALVPLESLERNVRVLRGSFDKLAQVNDSLMQQQGDTPPGRVIAVARPPVSPARPRKTLVAVVSTAGGLFFGMAAALFAESVSAQPVQAPMSPEPVEQAPPMPSGRRPTRRYWDDE